MSEQILPTAQSPLSEWLSYLEILHTSAIDLGLDRISHVAQKGQLTKPAPKVITVAGTNGKGSTCAIIEAILLKAGYKTGVYSSPHLIRYNERVRINGKELDDERHSEAFAAIEALRGETSLSLFEFGTLAALWLFLDNQVDVVILEVGLGGRLDATNIADHDVSVITSLAIDHVDWLGDDIEVIGFEKAGIFRSGKPAVCGQPEPPASVSAHADDIGAELHQVGYQFDYQRDGDVWHWQCGAFDLRDLPVPGLPLPNAATALMALGLSELDVTDEHIVDGLANVKLAGRMQRVFESPFVLLDVAHNPHSAAYLSQQIEAIKNASGAKVHAVVAMLHDKDITATLEQMKSVVDYWYPASLKGPRAADWQTLAKSLPEGVQGHATPSDAFESAKAAIAWDGDMIIVFGSFYTVGEIADRFSQSE
ncbi:bifunctional tetrahydrofolate synthase/dihydrofolate synthase [Enterovibrio nigricans]|uniref:Dihydrofolate synthase/folylpolyglutamate synthase n=1 Tax=Enterovibrio nigricans DSM 22720 TaxID=1121868 RepID=A0A1T4U880_9GAMM|nr:bifunctional tetrahydrofolate synthase/dihydrofolate synthase [Enterovibrio nigricans]SKA48738.1 dihydrofolate synthase / folylpolyglutamate synthase [Enterovibrio nigricans DSM 22720]